MQKDKASIAAARGFNLLAYEYDSSSYPLDFVGIPSASFHSGLTLELAVVSHNIPIQEWHMCHIILIAAILF